MLSFRNLLTCMFTMLLYYEVCISLRITQQAPAKVNLRFQISKLSQHFTNERIEFSLCIDKNKEKCFWSINDKKVELNDEMHKEIFFEFFINNMDENLTINIKMKAEGTKINFSNKMINLKKIATKDTFEFHSTTLENFVKMIVEHECVAYYYPPKQCTKFCFPVQNQYSCDGFGNHICKEGLYYNAEESKCLPNNCIKSNIQCYNNGYCVNKGSTFECKCLESYMGKFCELSNPCFPNPCLNKGRCFVKPKRNTPFCSCTAGFSGEKCDLKSYKRCSCPEKMRCNYSESGMLFSCTSENTENIVKPQTRRNSQNNAKVIEKLDKTKYQNWKYVSATTTMVAAIGCLMILISIGVSIYVFQRTKNYSALIKSRTSETPPSNFFTHHPPKFTEGTFKRTFSLDDNSAYLAVNPAILANTPRLLTLTSSNGYSINSNSYPENPAINFISCPSPYNEIHKQDLRSSHLIMKRNCAENNSTDSTNLSSSSLPRPPVLPPRPIHDNESFILPTQNLE